MTDLEDLFEGGIGKIAPDLLGAMAAEQTEDIFGAYKVESEIGRGGMGVVYKAQRNDGQFEQSVAIKLLPLQVATEAAQQRFQRERQILANLSHPNIARLLDGGLTPAGHLYLAMELIDGEPIDKYVDKHCQRVEQTLDIFQQVVEAVAHAQQQLIVHCDLKPSNIFVTRDGQVKLLDFGIARILESTNSGELTSEVTQTFNPVTPGYAAPEQLDSRPVGMYTDVYQLGLVLYRLLTGEKYRSADSQTPAELSPEMLTKYARIDEAKHKIDIDLLALLHKATSVDPGDRYASAFDLLSDLRRYRDGFAVLAHRPTFWHNTRKFVSRNRLLSSFVFTLSVGTLVFISILWQQEKRVSRERTLAVQQAKSAEEVVSYLASLLDAVVGDRGKKGEATTVLEMLLKSDEQLPSSFVDEPIVKERLYRLHGRSFYLTQNYDRAERNILAAIQAHEDSPPGSVSQRSLAESYYILGLIQRLTGRLPQAMENHLEAIAIVKASVEPDPYYLAELQLEMGVLQLTSTYDAAAASPYIEAATAYLKTRLLNNPNRITRQDYLYALRNRADVHLAAQRFSAALADTEAGIALVIEQWGEIEVTDVMIRQKARILALMGSFSEADSLLQNAYKKILARDKPVLLASIRTLLGNSNLLAQRYSEAARLLSLSLTDWKTHYGPEAAAVPSVLYSLARAQLGLGELQAARANAQEAYELGVQIFGDEDIRVADFRLLLGELSSDPNQALSTYQRVLATRVQKLPKEDWRIAEVRVLIQLAKLKLGMPAELSDPFLALMRNHEGVGPQQRAEVFREEFATLQKQ